MIFAVPYKNVNCAVDKTIYTGYTTSTDCNSNYRINDVIININTINDVIYYSLVQAFESGPI